MTIVNIAFFLFLIHKILKTSTSCLFHNIKQKQHKKDTICRISYLFLRVSEMKIFIFFGLSWKYNHLPWHSEQRHSTAARLSFFSGDKVRYLDVNSISYVKLFCISFSVISLRKNVWVFAPNPLPQITQTI